MNPNIKTAKRIAKLRTDRGYTQSSFAKAFSEFSGRKNQIANMTVSAWETGRKLPPASVILDLAKFYGVSTDYLSGLTDTIEESYTPSNKSNATPEINIRWSDLLRYDGQPIYVVFDNDAHNNQWGILDYIKKQVVFRDFTMDLSKQCSYYISIPADEITLMNKTRKFITMRSLMEKDCIWVESLSKDPVIRGKINGWYSHDVTRSFLINNSTGQTLPYNGLGVTFNAVEFL